MKILHITPAYYPATYWGGPIFSVYQMNNELARIPGVELKVLTTDSAGPKVSDRLSEAEKNMPFSYEVMFSRRIADASISPGLLRQLLKWISWADVVQINGLVNLQGAVAARLEGVRAAYELSETPPLLFLGGIHQYG